MDHFTKSRLTVIIPAYNEGKTIEDTILSLKRQTVLPEEIIVIDDCSTDDTFERAKALGVTVIRPPENTGSKAGAQNFALSGIATEFTMAVDADTTLAPDAIEKLIEALKDKDVAAACGYVVPRYVRTIWERGRYIEYLFAFSFYKEIQDYYEKPLISSGCFSVYRTEILKRHNGWPTRTLAEDMDLTWSFYRAGYGVRFVPDACCFPVEPHNYTFMRKQLKRWSHGFMQNVRIHWRHVMNIEYLRMIVAVALWDATIASVAYLFLLPLLAIIFRNPFFLLGYIIDAPAVLVPVFLSAKHERNMGRIISSVPSFFFLRTINSVFMLEAFWSELVMRKKFSVYEKGH
ncbi:MAG: glycosyltransferase family 2 protein [Candidatus Omnitrophica bacterium]|nr:glycosyltransferase family 2 protein [Candidatus Omnitrophota bacterium]